MSQHQALTAQQQKLNDLGRAPAREFETHSPEAAIETMVATRS